MSRFLFRARARNIVNIYLCARPRIKILKTKSNINGDGYCIYAFHQPFLWWQMSIVQIHILFLLVLRFTPLIVANHFLFGRESIIFRKTGHKKEEPH